MFHEILIHSIQHPTEHPKEHSTEHPAEHPTEHISERPTEHISEHLKDHFVEELRMLLTKKEMKKYFLPIRAALAPVGPRINTLGRYGPALLNNFSAH